MKKLKLLSKEVAKACGYCIWCGKNYKQLYWNSCEACAKKVLKVYRDCYRDR